MKKIIMWLVVMLLAIPQMIFADVWVTELAVPLSWNANPESDIQGYELYSSSTIDGPYIKLNGLITDTQYLDTEVVDGGEYYYKLRAIDLCDNISELSSASEKAIVDITAPEQVQNVMAQVINPCLGIVRLTWDVSTDVHFQDFIIRRNDVEVYRGAETEFTETLAQGSYIYTVTQRDMACWESTFVIVNVIVTPDTEPPTPPVWN